jgi:hypothetical protein
MHYPARARVDSGPGLGHNAQAMPFTTRTTTRTTSADLRLATLSLT